MFARFGRVHPNFYLEEYMLDLEEYIQINSLVMIKLNFFIASRVGTTSLSKPDEGIVLI